MVEDGCLLTAGGSQNDKSEIKGVPDYPPLNAGTSFDEEVGARRCRWEPASAKETKTHPPAPLRSVGVRFCVRSVCISLRVLCVSVRTVRGAGSRTHFQMELLDLRSVECPCGGEGRLAKARRQTFQRTSGQTKFFVSLSGSSDSSSSTLETTTGRHPMSPKDGAGSGRAGWRSSRRRDTRAVTAALCDSNPRLGETLRQHVATTQRG